MEQPSEMRALTTQELEHIATTMTCPFCDGPLHVGPKAGSCFNLFCLVCYARLNYCTAFGCPLCGQYIGQDRLGLLTYRRMAW